MVIALSALCLKSHLHKIYIHSQYKLMWKFDLVTRLCRLAAIFTVLHTFFFFCKTGGSLSNEEVRRSLRFLFCQKNTAWNSDDFLLRKKEYVQKSKLLQSIQWLGGRSGSRDASPRAVRVMCVESARDPSVWSPCGCIRVLWHPIQWTEMVFPLEITQVRNKLQISWKE